METIDTVPAHTLEVGDTISHGGDEIEILDTLLDDDDTRVAFRVHNQSSGMVEPLSLDCFTLVNILGE